MGVIFKTLYVYIYNLGLAIGDIFSSFARLIGSSVKRFFKFNKSSFSSFKTFFKRSIVFILIFAILVVSGTFLYSNNRKIDAIAIKLNDEIVGYAPTQSDADLAQNLASKYLNLASIDAFSTEEASTEPYNIKNYESLSEMLITKLSPELVKITEIYIDGEYLCAVTDRQNAKHIFTQYLESAKELYPTSSVSFAEEDSFKYAYYNKTDDRIWSSDQLELSLKTLGVLTIRHAECEKTLSTVEFDTVEIQTNTLFVGDARIRRNGQNGTEYAIDLVTYIGDKKVLSEQLMSVSVEKPVSQVVERGIRAESLSLGSYSVLQTTGYFCWPVVGLFTVTSPFGLRSLGNHKGIDISGANASGSLVVAGASGTVTEAGWSTGGYGNYVIIDHGNGIETLYAHMLDNSLMVNAGDIVTKGQAIGRVGNTGYSFGAHLHFEVRVNGNKINPAPYLGLE